MTVATSSFISGKNDGFFLAENIESYYGKIQALKGVSIEVKEGETVALIGANGAGKTTFLRSISGIQPITSGRFVFRGLLANNLRADQRVKAGICQSPEGRQVFGDLSIEDNLMLGGYRQAKKQSIDYLDFIYNLFPVLKEKKALPSGTLSGGQQQMLAIGRALMGRPKLLLLDEPSMGLAPILVQEIFDVIKKLKNEGVTIILAEQNATTALSIADRAYVLETGKIVMSGSGNELLNNEKVREAYLGI